MNMMYEPETSLENEHTNRISRQALANDPIITLTIVELDKHHRKARYFVHESILRKIGSYGERLDAHRATAGVKTPHQIQENCRDHFDEQELMQIIRFAYSGNVEDACPRMMHDPSNHPFISKREAEIRNNRYPLFGLCEINSMAVRYEYEGLAKAVIAKFKELEPVSSIDFVFLFDVVARAGSSLPCGRNALMDYLKAYIATHVSALVTCGAFKYENDWHRLTKEVVVSALINNEKKRVAQAAPAKQCCMGKIPGKDTEATVAKKRKVNVA